MPGPTQTNTPIATGDPVIAAAGDIACSPNNSSYNGGNGTATACRMKATSNLLVNAGLAAVLPLGDANNEDGALWIYEQSYHPTWGRVKNLTRPVPGNHDYLTAGASGYYTYFGPSAGDRTKGYYSYNIGAWHIIALNSNCSQVGGCGVGSPQEVWLNADLAANQNMCTLAYWHQPRFSSGPHGNNTAYSVFWRDLYAAGVEIVLNGHDHIYERFAPQSPGGAADPKGIQQFTSGTGGKNHTSVVSVQPNSMIRNADTFGVLQLTLHATSYDWQFVPEAGKTFTDSGTRNCFTPSSPQPTPAATKTPTAPPPIGTTDPRSSMTFSPAADSYVSAAIPNTNYGGSQQLRFDASPVVRGYLKFSVQGLTAPVVSAKLRIYANSSSSQGFHVHAIPVNTWGEQGITYSNAPGLGNPIGSSGAFAGGTWITVDVTSFVTGNGGFSLALVGINGTAVSLASRETGANAPQLIITTR
jgi:hypothetical protein